MIDIHPSEAVRQQYIHNIIDVYLSATDDQMTRGAMWYRVAHDIADMMSDGDVKTGAGVIAALSPQTSWEFNIELACDAVDAGNATRHLGDACGKANKIMAGIPPEAVLPMRRKSGHFYRCIVDPTDADAVCVDRHAHDLAVGQAYGDAKRGLDAHGRYELIAGCYKAAASILKELPQTVQAVTWVVWRERS